MILICSLYIYIYFFGVVLKVFCTQLYDVKYNNYNLQTDLFDSYMGPK